MNNRNQQQATWTAPPVQRSLPATAPAAVSVTHLNVFTVEESQANGRTQKRWTKIGAAFPHRRGTGFSIELQAFAVDGRLVVLAPDSTDDNRSSK